MSENYATRTVRTWIANTQEMYSEWQDRARAQLDAHDYSKEAAVENLAQELEDHFQEELDSHNLEGPLYDFAHNELAAVNWVSVAEDQFDDIEIWVARWNLPGCMPEMEPMLFGSFEHAQEAIIEELETVDDSQFDKAELITLENQISEVRACTGEFTVYYGGYAYVVSKL